MKTLTEANVGLIKRLISLRYTTQRNSLSIFLYS